MSTVALIILGVLGLLTLGVVFFGAPYVPTLRADVQTLFDKFVGPGDVLVDLGSGDGKVVLAAATRGNKAYGVELSPLLALVSWLRIRRYSGRAQIRIGSFWGRSLPDDTTVVFVFLAEPFMPRLQVYMQQETQRLSRSLRLISYGFTIPNVKPTKQHKALIEYTFQPNKV